MLSTGTRIGPYQIKGWIQEGSCGQSYLGEAGTGEHKGTNKYLKLFHRDLAEREGFTDYFSQECRVIQQLEGRGVWPLLSNGINKWKHWLVYEWFDGHTEVVLGESEDDQTSEVSLRSLADWLELFPELIGPENVKAMMIDLHCGLYRAHAFGVIHGNLKPSNILLKGLKEGTTEAWATEFSLAKVCQFQSPSEDARESSQFISQSLQFQESLKQSQQYRFEQTSSTQLPEEDWDLHALGGLVQTIIDKNTQHLDQWIEWKKWSAKALNRGFRNIAMSMEAIPGIEDLSDYGVQGSKADTGSNLSKEEIRRQKEIEWEKQQKISTTTFRRNMTGLVGGMCLLIFLFSRVYTFFIPSPWVEYSVEGASDTYQLGFGIWSGKAWGVLPADYDDEGDGGHDVAGEWVRDQGMYRLDFRKFRKINEEESGKKLWQFIGKGVTKESDYYIWSDYLKFQHAPNQLTLVKRVHDGEVFVPGQRGNDSPRLFSELRIRRGGGTIKKTELLFKQREKEGPAWSVYIGIGFIIASLMYHRNLSSIDNISAGKN